MAIEREIKLSLSPSLLGQLSASLKQSYGTPVCLDLSNTYYDSPDQQLAKAKMALRVRKHPDGYIQTFKRPLPGDTQGFERLEDEWQLSQPQLQPELLTQLEGWQEQWPIQELQPQFSTEFVRQQWQIEQPEGHWELALDQGQIQANGQTLLICELEVELKAGEMSAMQSFVGQWVQQWPLMLFPLSKAARAQALLAGTDPWASQPMNQGLLQLVRGYYQLQLKPNRQQLDAWLQTLARFAPAELLIEAQGFAQQQDLAGYLESPTFASWLWQQEVR